jgi:hypothetical protein
MKKKYLLLGLMTASFCATAQKAPEDSFYKKQKLSETDVQIIFSYYTQDGNHSAVTGGTGTEELMVYAPEVTINHKRDSVQTFSLNAGVDIITSASTDNIDFVMTSASRVDMRSHVNLGYSRRLGHSNMRAGINTGLSVESDYTSLPVGLNLTYTDPDGSREWTAALQCYFDDLRWGRIDDDYWHPVSLVYPAELRYREWYDTYRRTSYNLSFALYQVVNKRIQVALFPELTYQKGLLSTPFHRVFFTDPLVEKVEYLPEQRWKIPIGVQANIFAGKRVIIRSYYRFYWDDIGIRSHTFQLELPVKITPQFSIAPHVRFYTQTASTYFRPYKQHEVTEKYYTSDYDLSAFNSYKAGMTLRYAPQARFMRHGTFKEIGLRYAYYKRSDGLYAHMMSLLLDFKYSKP